MNLSRMFANKIISPARTFLFRRSLQTTQVLRLQEGDCLPSVELYEDSPTCKVNLAELAKGKKLVIFGVPGAFTPVCSKSHLPGYIEEYDRFKIEGVHEIICISVNDPFVMKAWGEQHQVEDKIRLLADPQAKFIKEACLGIDLPPLGGIRSKRFSMVVENGEVKQLLVEPDGTGLSCSVAENLNTCSKK